MTTRGFGGRNFIGGIGERQVCHRCQDARDKSKRRWLFPPPQPVRGHPRCGQPGTGGHSLRPRAPSGHILEAGGRGSTPRVGPGGGQTSLSMEMMMAVMMMTITPTTTTTTEQTMFATLARSLWRRAPSRSPTSLQSRAWGANGGLRVWGALIGGPTHPGVAARLCWDHRDVSPRARGEASGRCPAVPALGGGAEHWGSREGGVASGMGDQTGGPGWESGSGNPGMGEGIGGG